jgi:hypothetical protein
MAFPSVTNVDGTNPGPNNATPDTPQAPIGNIWKNARLSATLSPVAVAPSTSAEQTFTVTGLLTTDYVYVNKPSADAGVGIVGARVSAADTLALTFMNATTATVTPTASESYIILVERVQPNWTAPASGSPIDW